MSESTSDSNTSTEGASQGQEPGKDAAADSGNARAGEELSRKNLEEALAAARDEAAKNRQKAKFAFPDEESYRRASEALGMLDKAEQDKKSVEQQLTEKNEQLLYRAAESEKGLMRLRVALGAGVESSRIDEFASRLRGDTEDELKKDAAELQRLFALNNKPERRADPSQGAGREQQPVSDPILASLQEKLGIAH